MRIVVVTAQAAEAELAADVLWQLGVRGVEERRFGETTELRTSVGEDDGAIDRLRAAVAGRWAMRIDTVDDGPADTWREFVEPIRVADDLVVVPAWLEAPPGLPEGATVVAIEPAGAFGLGDHPTTRLSLAAVRRLVGPGSSALDVGCGTGVLAVVAALRSGRVVRAVDIADAAVSATQDNAARNGVAGQVVADTSPLAALGGPYDVVLANILAPTLVELAPHLVRLTAPGGRLAISGILAGRHEHVLAALAPLVVERTDELDGWAAVTLHHPG